MGGNCCMLLMAIILFISGAPLGHSLMIDGNNITKLIVSATAFCTPTGNPNPVGANPGLAGANVTVGCNGGQLPIGSGITNGTGSVEINIPLLDEVPFNCTMRIPLPVPGCNALPSAGFLEAPLRKVSNGPHCLLATSVRFSISI